MMHQQSNDQIPIIGNYKRKIIHINYLESIRFTTESFCIGLDICYLLL